MQLGVSGKFPIVSGKFPIVFHVEDGLANSSC